jgi:hypothetical protein
MYVAWAPPPAEVKDTILAIVIQVHSFGRSFAGGGARAIPKPCARKHKNARQAGLTTVTHSRDRCYRFFPRSIPECGQLLGMSARAEG